METPANTHAFMGSFLPLPLAVTGSPHQESRVAMYKKINKKDTWVYWRTNQAAVNLSNIRRLKACRPLRHAYCSSPTNQHLEQNEALLHEDDQHMPLHQHGRIKMKRKGTSTVLFRVCCNKCRTASSRLCPGTRACPRQRVDRLVGPGDPS